MVDGKEGGVALRPLEQLFLGEVLGEFLKQGEVIGLWEATLLIQKREDPNWVLKMTSFVRERGASIVVVSTSVWHAGRLGSIPRCSKHGIFGVETWLSILGTAYPS